MRLFKLGTTSLVLGILGLFLWQNSGSFGALLPFQLDLHIREPIHWEHQVSSLILFSGFFGFLLGLLVMGRPYRRLRRVLAQERQERLVREAAPREEHLPESSRQAEPPAEDGLKDG